jgi:hypothetical protein
MKIIAASLLVWTIGILPSAVLAQTVVKMPKNKYPVSKDIELGRQAAGEAEQVFPVLNDSESQRYLDNLGRKLVAATPPEFRHPEFGYTFKIIHVADINAFALPAGYMYVDSGLIMAARNEGELVGVMAHELSHVQLRHATSQATKVNNPWNQILGIGSILGGAILGGQTGAQLGQVFAAGFFTRYSRTAEKEADIVGSHIMADANYDPQDLANMFKTIQSSGGAHPPEWLSSHPDPGNRYQYILKERELLRVSSGAIRDSSEFQRIKRKMQALPKAKTMAQIEQEAKGKQGQSQTSGGRYEESVSLPSARMRSYSGGNWISLNVPDNWKDFPSQTSIQFAPLGAYGDQGITHGVMIGITKGHGATLQQESEEYVSGVLQGNDYLRQQSNYSNTRVSSRYALSTVLAGTSPVTGRTEVVTIYTTLLRNGDVFSFITVVPQNEESRYRTTFNSMLSSIRLKD